MMVQCRTCQLWYEDELRWTICPHNYLQDGPEAKDNTYCREHDLFRCPFHKDRKAERRLLRGWRWLQRLMGLTPEQRSKERRS
jgi:hypothetical protein